MSGSLGYSTTIQAEVASTGLANARVTVMVGEVMAEIGGGASNASSVTLEALLGDGGGSPRSTGLFAELLVQDHVYGPYVPDNYKAWTIKPDFVNPVTERIRFRTDTLTSQSGAEQRRRLRNEPRMEIDCTYTVWRKNRRLLDAIMMGQGGSIMHTPLWWDKRELTSAVNVGDTQIALDLLYSEFEVGATILILGSDPFAYELLTVRAIGQNQLFLNNSVAQTWNAGTTVYMTKLMRVVSQAQATRHADESFVIQLTHASIAYKSFPAAASEIPDPYNAPLAIRPAEMADLTFEYVRNFAEFDNESGLPARRDLMLQALQVIQIDQLLHGRAQYYAFKQLLYFFQGKLQPFYAPTYMNDLQFLPNATINPTDNFIFVTRCGLTEMLGSTSPGRRVLGIYFRDGTNRLYTILNVAVTADDEEAILLTTTVGRRIVVGDIKRISFGAFYRLDQDDIELSHVTDTTGVTTCTMMMRSLASVVRTNNAYVMAYYTGTYVKNPDPAVIPVDLSKAYVPVVTPPIVIQQLIDNSRAGGEANGEAAGETGGSDAQGGAGGSGAAGGGQGSDGTGGGGSSGGP